jgi:antirestriction protein
MTYEEAKIQVIWWDLECNECGTIIDLEDEYCPECESLQDFRYLENDIQALINESND